MMKIGILLLYGRKEEKKLVKEKEQASVTLTPLLSLVAEP